MNGLGLYQVATAAFEPLAPLILKVRARRGKEDPARMGERMGRAGMARPGGSLVWLHGVSVGESLSLLPLIDHLRAQRPDLNLLVTSGTVTAASLLARRLPPDVIHQYAPIDGRGSVTRFLDHWRPAVGLFAESELWPNLIMDAHSRGVKLALVSARITARSADGWSRRPKAARALLSAFDLVLPQDEASAIRLQKLGATAGPRLNLKLAGSALPCDDAELKTLRATVKGRPVILAASTHAGEEALIAKARPAGALLIVAVRHPDRGAQVAAELAASGLVVGRRGAREAITPKTDIYVADTLGEMGLWFRLADLTVMGGSLVEGIGGHNPLEPARLDSPVVSGPHLFNFADVYQELSATGAVAMVAPDQLAETLNRLMADPAARKAMIKRARLYAEQQSSALEHGFQLIDGLLPTADAS